MRNVFLDEITEQISLPMALVDYIPVILFVCTCVILLRHFFNKMKVWNYVVLCVGCGGVALAGVDKAIWKTVCAFGTNITWMDSLFFPLQAASFVVLAVGLLIYGFLLRKEKKTVDNTTKTLSVLPFLPLVLAMSARTLVCVMLLVCGFSGLVIALILITLRTCKHKVLPIILFILSFFFMMGMGYLGVKFDDSSSMHWIAQLTNICGQGCLFAGSLLIYYDVKKNNGDKKNVTDSSF